mmetsp:Transcript_88290/g.254655  ORF Transcript_88290/g.254655 Transcript_88290/m.254655 type:complete len:115 (-) Transcript_88290:190-534(-)
MCADQGSWKVLVDIFIVLHLKFFNIFILDIVDITQLLENPLEVVFPHGCSHMSFEDRRAEPHIVLSFTITDCLLPEISVVTTRSNKQVKEKEISLRKHDSVFERFECREWHFIN